LTLKTQPNNVNYKFITNEPYILGDKTIEVLKDSFVIYYVSKAGYTPVIGNRVVQYDITENITLEKTTFDYSLDLRYTDEEVEDYYDYGLLTEEPTFTTDLQGIMPSIVTEILDCRYTTEQVETTINCGDITEQVETIINCGDITDEVRTQEI
jgi:hypothetical protein